MIFPSQTASSFWVVSFRTSSHLEIMFLLFTQESGRWGAHLSSIGNHNVWAIRCIKCKPVHSLEILTKQLCCQILFCRFTFSAVWFSLYFIESSEIADSWLEIAVSFGTSHYFNSLKRGPVHGLTSGFSLTRIIR